jgi:ribosomal protein S18 acetylase RimI-like enzyme
MKTDEEMDGKGYVHWKSWQETYAGLMPQACLDKLSLEQTVSWAHSWPQNTLVLKKNDQVIGFSCFGESHDPDLGQAGEVIALYLLRAFQGQGLGLQLMKATMAELADRPQVILWVLKGNEKAIRFYRRYGFEFDGTERTKAHGTELRMRLRP